MAGRARSRDVTTYNYAQLESLWDQAGGSQSLAPLMAAIALAESGGDSAALNLNDNGGTQTSVGLWQVSNGTHNYPASWTTPLGNAQEAVAKLKSQGLTAWGTYTSGAYKRFYQGGVAPAIGPLAGTTSGSAGTDTTVQQASFGNSTVGGTCLLGFNGVNVPILGNVGGFCVFSKTEGRALIGGLLVGIGGLGMLVSALVLLKAFGAEVPKIAQPLAQRIQRVPGALQEAPSVEVVPQASAQPAKAVDTDELITALRARGNKLAPRVGTSGTFTAGGAASKVGELAAT